MKIKKILLSLLIILFSITSFTSNTYAFSTSEKEKIHFWTFLYDFLCIVSIDKKEGIPIAYL